MVKLHRKLESYFELISEAFCLCMRRVCDSIFSVTCVPVLLPGLEQYSFLVAYSEMASLNRDVRVDKENVLLRKWKIWIVRSPQMGDGCQ